VTGLEHLPGSLMVRSNFLPLRTGQIAVIPCARTVQGDSGYRFWPYIPLLHISSQFIPVSLLPRFNHSFVFAVAFALITGGLPGSRDIIIHQPNYSGLGGN
jgi:hypothetical protein